jgi:hypothetical protein
VNGLKLITVVEELMKVIINQRLDPVSGRLRIVAECMLNRLNLVPFRPDPVSVCIMNKVK